METKYKETNNEHNRFHDENGNYRKQDINWMKVIISTVIALFIIGSIVAFWGWGLGGFSWGKMRKEAELLYETVYVNHDIEQYTEDTNAIWTDDAYTQLVKTNDKLTTNDYHFSSKSYVVEISKKTTRNDCWISITDKTILVDDIEDGDPMPTIFVHQEIIDGQLNITGLTDVYGL